MKQSHLLSVLVLGALCCSSLLSCVVPAHEEAPSPSTLNPPLVRMVPGQEYAHHTGWFVFGYWVYPQVAIWLEDTKGNYLGTIHVTEKGARKSWISAPPTGRPNALPVWTHVCSDSVDAVSAATQVNPDKALEYPLPPLPPGHYFIRVEVNRSYDWNEHYPEKHGGVLGQPSLVYSAELTIDGSHGEVAITPIGTGSLDGSDGNINPDLGGIDSAFSLFNTMTLLY